MSSKRSGPATLLVGLAGQPNVGKSTVFNLLTGFGIEALWLSPRPDKPQMIHFLCKFLIVTTNRAMQNVPMIAKSTDSGIMLFRFSQIRNSCLTLAEVT